MLQTIAGGAPAPGALSGPAERGSRSPAKGGFDLQELGNFPDLVAIYDRYLSQAFWESHGDGLTLVVPTSFHALGLQKCQASLEKFLARPIRAIEARRIETPAPAQASFLPGLGLAPNEAPQPSPQMSLPLPSVFRPENPKEIERRKRQSPPKFVRSNAYETCHQLAQRWATGINEGARGQSLWVHGRPGGGKTCLLKQLHEWVELDHKLHATDVMKFFHEWRRSLENKENLSFVRKYRKDIDVLILENLDELDGKTRTQQEVLFTINAILDHGGSVAVSSSRHPLELKEVLEASLYSRLFSGLILEMPQPDRAFKEKLWRQLLDDYGLSDSMLDIMIQERLLSIGVDTARKAHTLFINAIGRLSLKKTLNGQDLTELESLHSSGTALARPGQSRNPSEILDKVARLCGVSRAAILGKVRRSDIALARRFACLALSRFVGLTNASIARFVEKDPSTVSHALRTIECDLQSDRNINEQWNWICSQLGIPVDAR